MNLKVIERSAWRTDATEWLYVLLLSQPSYSLKNRRFKRPVEISPRRN